MKKARSWLLAGLLIAGTWAASGGLAVPSDALPSWNEGAAKAAVVRFVDATTRAGSPEFVLPAHRIAVFEDPAKAVLTPHEPPAARVAPGAGPRHLALHPRGRQAYVINELGSTITVFDYEAAGGTLTETETVGTLPEGWTGNSTTAEIEVHPSGKFLYGSNRGHDSLAIFAVGASGRLTLVGHQPTLGKTPRSFAIDPTGRFLLAANQGSDSAVLFRIDPATGQLTATGQTLRVGSPVCVLFLTP